MEKQFGFAPPDHQKRASRLVRLLYVNVDAHDESHRHRLVLLHTDLDDAPEHQALSYTWSSPTKTLNIYIDRKVFAIFKLNLLLAYTRLGQSI